MAISQSQWLQLNMQSENQLLTRADHWLDLCLPASTTALLAAQQTLAYSLLGLWLVARLGLRCKSQPLYLIFLGITLTTMGELVLERGNKPSDSYDLLIMALAFAAGAQRQANRWTHSLTLISTCLIPITAAAILKPPDLLLQFPEINVNRLSFLLGLLLTATWGRAELSGDRRTKLSWLAWGSLSIPLSLMSGSRAPLILPAIAIAIAKLLSNNQLTHTKEDKSRRQALQRIAAASAMIGALLLVSTQLWYRYSSESEINRISDTWRTNTALCWAKQPLKQGQPWLGLGHANTIRRKCNNSKLPEMGEAVEKSHLSKEQRDVAIRAAAKGLPHAHNTYAQIFAETGLLGVSAITLLGIWLARKAQQSRFKRTIERTDARQLIQKASLPIAIYFAITAATTSFHIYLPLNQILIGYLLASFSARAGDQATSA